MNYLEVSDKPSEDLKDVLKIDEVQLRSHLGELVRGTVEETLNKLLDDEADRLCNAARYEHSESRTDT